MISEDPHGGTLVHKDFAEEQTVASVGRIAIIEKLRVQQMRCEGNAALIYCKSAVTAGSRCVALRISRIR